MAYTDWIPPREQDFVDLCQKWLATIGKDENLSAFDPNMEECMVVRNKINAFLTARTAYEADNSSAKRLAKDEAKEAAADAMIEVRKNYI